MVLEEVSSDPDPYSFDDPPTSTLQTPQADLSRLPSPIAFSAAWGFSTARLQKGIALEQANAGAVLERPVTPEEADAIAYHFAKGYRYASYGPPIGVAVGTWRAVKTYDEMRWPLVPRFFSNWSRWNFDKETQSVTFGGRQLARGAWLRPTIIGLKTLMYVNFGLAIGAGLASVYAATVTGVGSLRDPRLKTLGEKTVDYVNKNNGVLGKPIPPSGAETAQKRADPMGQGERTAAELWKDHRRAIGRRDDDASPTAGNEDDFFNEEAEKSGGGNDSMLTDSQIQAQQQQQRRQQPSPRRSSSSSRRTDTSPASSAFQMEKTELPQQSRSFSDDYDMTSPSSAEDQSPTSSTAPSGESAWDRVRRENASSSSSSSSSPGSKARRPQRRDRTQQQEGSSSTPGESYTFSSADSERAYAREEAQKHFDERVEQERRGEDFGSGGGRSRRW